MLSHEPRLNPDLVRGPDGNWIDGVGPTIRSLTLAELKRYDIGRINPASSYSRMFPKQIAIDGERFPALTEVYAAIPAPMRFNIEIKTDPTRPNDTADPGYFTRLVVDAVKDSKAVDRTMIQSFDWRTLIEARKLAPEIPTACLTIETQNSDTIRRNDAMPSPWLGGPRPQGPWRLGAAAGEGRRLRGLVAVLAQPDARDPGRVPQARAARSFPGR